MEVHHFDRFQIVRDCLIHLDLSQSKKKYPDKAPIPNIFPILYDRENRAIANNLKPICTVIVSGKNKSVSSI